LANLDKEIHEGVFCCDHFTIFAPSMKKTAPRQRGKAHDRGTALSAVDQNRDNLNGLGGQIGVVLGQVPKGRGWGPGGRRWGGGAGMDGQSGIGIGQ